MIDITPEHRKDIEHVSSKLPRQDSQNYMPGVISLSVIFDLDPWVQGFYYQQTDGYKTPILVEEHSWTPNHLEPGAKVDNDILATLQVYLAQAYLMNYTIEDIKTCIRYKCSKREVYNPKTDDFETFATKHTRHMIQKELN